ncbi:hypothetical protein LOD99_14343 [Oopsacas minuta]|uniref:Uncharacterized protein n=1 Tax=Oopsacas minuta TaxID=111878 RepID=A0AAV7KF74_9METZ|nr:hypothetical protein LOD99_14343 [Oopsacas minuta]
MSSMKYIGFKLLIFLLQLYTLVNSQVPTSGCNAISNKRTCFRYFTSSGVNWADARQQCVVSGYDLATVTSTEENTLMYGTLTDSTVRCWIGLNDINAEGTYIWADGSDSAYRNWAPGEPNSNGNEDCVQTFGNPKWNDLRCTNLLMCYFCSTHVNTFGEIIASTPSSLSDNAVLITDTTLYCVTENMNTPEVMWSYVDLAGIRTDLTATTDSSTGVSTIQVYTTQPGYYSCDVTEDGGTSRTYTAIMTDTNEYAVPTTGCDAITNERTCFSYFTSTGVNWADARLQCLVSGYDLATVTSTEENTLMYSTASGSTSCWIGLNDLNAEGTFIWADGSDSTYRNWTPGEPNNSGDEDCVHTHGNTYWNDLECTPILTCYFCSTHVNTFGEIIASTPSSLSDNAVLITDTTLYCVTENMNTPEVMWSYVDLAGIRTDLTATTDSSTGVSTIQVYTTQPGYYSCDVTEDGGTSRTYTAIMTDTNEYTVPTTGCDVVTNDGTCFSYFTSTGTNWADARLQCVVSGYDLATVTSTEENTLMYGTLTDSTVRCWIGLNDINAEGTYIWADGSDSAYRNWAPGEPNSNGNEDCVQTFGNPKWNDLRCTNLLMCYFCSTHVNTFGEIIASTPSSLSDNAVLITDTTLYCVTENMNTPEVMWSYVDLAGIRTDLTATTDSSTGVSTIQVYTTQPGYYSCDVTEDGGTSRTYTAIMTDTNEYTVPTTGCDVVTNDGTCFSYFTSTGTNWADARLQCVVSGYDLATVTSTEENTLMYSTASGSTSCWIGLNDLNAEGTFIWADGSDSTYRNWTPGEPNNSGDEDCVYTRGNTYWNDLECTPILTCYFCSTHVNTFGEIIASTPSSLSDNAILITDTTLYCVTENMNTPEVMWSYVDLAGIRTDLTATTDSSTGVSTIQVYTTQPGYYSCDVTENGGVGRIYTVGILNIHSYTEVVNSFSYTYTIGIDSEDIYLLYTPTDSSVQLTNIHWMRDHLPGIFPNPLDIFSLTYYISSSSNITLECLETNLGNTFVSIGLLLQGPPLITLNHGSINSFSLLAPDVNTADVTVLTQNVVLSSNLFGRWQKPDDTSVTHNSITFLIFYQYDEGLYKFYVTNWDGEETLAIQLYISIMESSFGQQINSDTYISLEEGTILITDTTLYCVAEDKTTSEPVWSYVDPTGTQVNLPPTANDAITGISTLYVYSNQPGYYSCEVTNQGMTRTHTVRMLDTTLYTEAIDSENYTYIIEVDEENIFLFCNTNNSLIQLSNIYWRRKDRIGFYSNPLDVFSLRNTLILTNNQTMECFDIESDNNILSVGLFIQGPPLITLNHGSINSFSLLAPDVNTADVTVLTQNVVLSSNLFGRWQKPDDTSVTHNSITFLIFYQYDEGLYKFYVTNWDGEETLAIQIYISIMESSFGQQINSDTYISLEEGTILITDTTLYCVAEDKTTSEPVWSYVDPTGTQVNLPPTANDAITGISTLYVYSNQPGYYSCEVTNQGMTRTHTVRMLDTTLYTEAIDSENYTYIIEVDEENIFLFCNTNNSLIQLSNIYWRRKDRIGFYSNPLDVFSLRNTLILTNNQTMECFDIESDNNILSVGLFIQGPPLITLNHGSINSFSLLAPDVNTADVTVLTQNVVLSSNLFGRWQKPDDTRLYKFYVTNWDGEETLAIQMKISSAESTQKIINLSTEASSESSILVLWDLLEASSSYTDIEYSVYLGFSNYQVLAGTTINMQYEITQLITNVNYSIRVEFQIPFSIQIISSTIYHFFKSNDATTATSPVVINNNITQSTASSSTTADLTNQVLQSASLLNQYSSYILIVGIAVMIILLILFFIMTVLIVCCVVKRKKNRSQITSHTNPQLYQLPAIPNAIYDHVANVNMAYLPEIDEKDEKDITVDLAMEKESPTDTSTQNDYTV